MLSLTVWHVSGSRYRRNSGGARREDSRKFKKQRYIALNKFYVIELDTTFVHLIYLMIINFQMISVC